MYFKYKTSKLQEETKLYKNQQKHHKIQENHKKKHNSLNIIPFKTNHPLK